ncbi:MAG: ribulose-phosphate 3-epimerase [Deltaproteobacteria bacterium]|nr:ribulose-phosphate 3-epimerase [Deltaproteobacteria bacterium]MBW2676138.1 ribulose-phosphate 3-epimerase [Deltaproteobacteria bacterium]
MKLIAPSILSADFSKLGDEIRAVEKAGADWIHIDVMDGHFVPNITIGPLVVAAVKKVTNLPLDVHLMIENPEQYISAFTEAGADLITVQVETCPHLNRVIQMIHHAGAKAGAVLNPSTSLATIEWELENLELVMVMSVNPGFGGQKFIPAILDKVRMLKQSIKQKGLNTLIEIDGGVNKDTIKGISDAGVDIFVAGSAIFGSVNYQETIESFRRLIG